jgi:hypothetical protein
MDLLEIGWGGVDWISLAQDTKKWSGHKLVKSQRSSELSTRAATQRREERNSRIED